jgi:hypothetical protein
MVCEKSSLVEVEPEKFKRFQKDEHVQNVWPEKDADWRELLITGTHPECWDRMMEDMDE